jgi:hypothetical protein
MVFLAFAGLFAAGDLLHFLTDCGHNRRSQGFSAIAGALSQISKNHKMACNKKYK